VKNTFKIKGRIVFDPPNITSKHERQNDWKKVAMLEFDCDIRAYYRWFLKKRYHLFLSETIRKAHVTFINDHKREIKMHKWKDVRKRWEGKEVEIELDVDIRSDGTNWWLVVTEESREELHDIRRELGMGRPYFGLHLTVGIAKDSRDEFDDNSMNVIRPVRRTEDHSKYILRLIKKGLSY
jgi:hypothetical protein